MVYFKVIVERYGVPIDDFLLEIHENATCKSYTQRLESMMSQWLKQTNERRKSFNLPLYQRKEFFPYVKYLGKDKKQSLQK